MNLMFVYFVIICYYFGVNSSKNDACKLDTKSKKVRQFFTVFLLQKCFQLDTEKCGIEFKDWFSTTISEKISSFRQKFRTHMDKIISDFGKTKIKEPSKTIKNSQRLKVLTTKGLFTLITIEESIDKFESMLSKMVFKVKQLNNAGIYKLESSTFGDFISRANYAYIG